LYHTSEENSICVI